MENSAIDTVAAELSTADFAIDLGQLSAAVDYLAKRITEKRNTTPILDCVLLTIDALGLVRLTATDLDIEASLTLRGQVDSPGMMAISASLLQTTLAKARKSSADEIRFTECDGRATVKAGRARFSMPLAKADDFPKLPFAAPLSRFALPAGQFLADLAALLPCVSTEESRYYLNGARLAVEALSGQERLAMVATDGCNIAVASRAVPAGAEGLPDMILPSKTMKALVALGKFKGGDSQLAVEHDGKRLHFTLPCQIGAITITTKLIDGTFPDWQQAFAVSLAPIEATPALFPELLPGAPVKAIEAIAKGAPGPIVWERARQGFLGTVAGDDGLLFGAFEDLSGEPVKGFKFERTGEAEAQAYLESLAASRGLPPIAEIEARAAAINAEYGEPDNAAYNGRRPFGKATSNGAQLIKRGNRVVGLTVSGEHEHHGWREKVQCWETLSEREVYHDSETAPIEGSYSILMPATGPQLAWTAPHSIEGADGHKYLIADNGSKIHMSADQVRALIGESCFETMAIPIPDSHPLYRKFRGEPAYIARWLYDQGDSRLLIVKRDGRCFDPAKYARDYLARDEVDALLTETWQGVDPVAALCEVGLVVQNVAEIEAPAPSVEIPTEPAPESAPEPVAPVMVAAEPAIALSELERAELTAIEAPASQPVDISPDISVLVADSVAQPDCQPDPIAALVARIEALERQAALVDQVSSPPAAESVATPIAAKRTPAHERAVRRAWQVRRERRIFRDAAEALTDVRNDLQTQLQAKEGLIALYNADFTATEGRIDRHIAATDVAEAKRRRAVLLAWDQRSRAQHYRANWKEEARRCGIAEAEATKVMACADRMADLAKAETKRANDAEGLVQRERFKRRRSTRLARYRGEQMAILAGIANAKDLRVTVLAAEVSALRAIPVVPRPVSEPGNVQPLRFGQGGTPQPAEYNRLRSVMAAA